jgi:diguanylate cyclase (GGDEF)-like protein
MKTIEARSREHEIPLLLRATEALLLAAYDEQAVLATATSLLGDHYGYGTRSILLYQKGADELVMGHAAGPGSDDAAVQSFRRKLGEGISGVAAKTRSIVNVGDLAADPRTVRIGQGQRSRLCVPMLVRHELLGVISVESPQANAFGPRDEETLAAFSHVTALALIHARSDERRRTDIAQLKVISEVATTAAKLDLDASLRVAAEGFQRATSSDSTAIYLWNERAALLELAKVTFDPRFYPADYEERMREQPLALGEGMIGWAAQHREATVIDDVAKDPRPQPVTGVPLSQKSAIVIPLVVEDRLLGVIRAVKAGVGAFTNDQFRFAQTLASQLALLLAAAQAKQEQERLAITDDLTSLYNSRYFTSRLETEMQRAQRYGHRLALLIVDSDALKRVNDQLGHAAGNQLLVDLARTIKEHVRATDLIARYGGDEFVVLQPETDLENAVAMAERIRQAAFAASDVAGVERSVSVGVATYPGTAKDAASLFQAADDALYRAKRAGKDRVAVAGAES